MCFNYNRKGHYSDHLLDANNGDGQGGDDTTNVQQLQIRNRAGSDDIVEEIQEFIDTEEVEESDYDSDEGSVIINFQYLQLKWEMNNAGHDATNQQKYRRIITKRLSMAATRASQSGRYWDSDVLLYTGSTCSVFKNEDMAINIVKSKTIMRAITNGSHQASDYTRIEYFFYEGHEETFQGDDGHGC